MTNETTYTISVDTGGTFTDVVVADNHGKRIQSKALTDTRRAYTSVEEGLKRACKALGTTVPDILSRTVRVTYGTTRSINAIVEGKTARTAFMTTLGFPDILLLREGGKRRPYEQQEYSWPYVPRYLTREIHERVTADGSVEQPLNDASVIAALDSLKQYDIEAVGVCLLWAAVNPEHELRVREIIQQHAPGISVTVSHEVCPAVREYRRASAAVIDASLKPLMQNYVSDLRTDLLNAGLTGHLLLSTSYGGAWTPDAIMEKPIYSVGSGPAMAPVGALHYARLELESLSGARHHDLVVADTGGTTLDVSVVRDGKIELTDENWLGERYQGHITGTRSVSVKSIGSGGGSIAWVDAAGLLHVGPHSAGSDPGPACYGLGGTQPTVTDAALLAGYLTSENFIGGELSLDASLSEKAIQPLLSKTGLAGVSEAARGILTVATESIASSIREATVAHGLDPRRTVIVAGGGASGIYIVDVAKRLGCEQVIIPKSAGVLSACGALVSKISAEFARTDYQETATFDHNRANATLASLHGDAMQFVSAINKIPRLDESIEYGVQARYKNQIWEIPVPVRTAPLDAEGLDKLKSEFDREHYRRYAVSEPKQTLEFLTWWSRADIDLVAPPEERLTRRPSGTPIPKSSTVARFDGMGNVRVPRYWATDLAAGDEIPGPAIVLEETTTIVVYPETTAFVSTYGNYIVEIHARP